MLFRKLKNYLRRLRLRRAGVIEAAGCGKASYGSGDGCWLVCPDNIDENSVVYSFGVGRDLSFDLALIDKHGTTVHAFDPTPASVAWVAEQQLPDQLIFHPLGVADFDGELEFHPPRKTTSAHFTPVKRYRADSAAPIKAPVKRLQTIMDDLGHQRVNLLKLDIEGGEYQVLADLLDGGIPVDQLLVEFHHMYQTIPLQKTLAMLHRLRAAGFVVFAISERSYEISLIRSDTGNFRSEAQ